MRENRTSGSEGGGAKPIVSSYPYWASASYKHGTPDGVRGDLRRGAINMALLKECRGDVVGGL
jgi:hypothetical protein